MEHHVRRDAGGPGPLEPPFLQRGQDGSAYGPSIRTGPGRRWLRQAGGCPGDLPQEAARPAPGERPRQAEVPSRPGHADVEEPALLGEGLVRSGPLERHLSLLEVREEHRVELQALGPVIGEQVDPAAGALGGEPGLEVRHELADGSGAIVIERFGQLHQPGQVGLAGGLLLAQTVGGLFGQALSRCRAKNRAGHGLRVRVPEAMQDRPGRLPGQEGAVPDLERDARRGEGRFEVLRA